MWSPSEASLARFRCGGVFGSRKFHVFSFSSEFISRQKNKPTAFTRVHNCVKLVCVPDSHHHDDYWDLGVGLEGLVGWFVGLLSFL